MSKFNLVVAKCSETQKRRQMKMSFLLNSRSIFIAIYKYVQVHIVLFGFTCMRMTTRWTDDASDVSVASVHECNEVCQAAISFSGDGSMSIVLFRQWILNGSCFGCKCTY